MTQTKTLRPDEALSIMREHTVLVAGAGVAGRGVIMMLRALDARIVVADDHVTGDGDAGANERYITVGEAANLIHSDEKPALVITSPGWRPDSPLLVNAQEAGVPVIGDIEAAWLADQAGAFGSPRQWIAITGTNGKTTTTAMTTAMFVADGRAATAVGNIGMSPCLALTAETRGDARVDVLVAEVSSFQLHWAPTFSPDAGCVLNLAEDHLDWHGSFAGYGEDKARVLKAHTAVLSADEPEVMEVIHRLWPDSADYPFDSATVIGTSEAADLLVSKERYARVSIIEGEIVETAASGEQTVLASAEGISPPGPAGIADATAAAALARSAGVDASSIAQALKTFTVQAHRGQVVAETAGITWIDNSKATNPHAAAAALRGQRDVVWVAGGQLKGASVDELITDIADALKAAVVLGIDRHIIAETLAKHAPNVPVTIVDSTDPRGAMEETIAAARSYADAGDRVILAPAAASLDMYSGMSQRGDLFAECAMEGN